MKEYRSFLIFHCEVGSALDIETRRKKQQALMVQAMERRVRSRAQQIYESQGQAEGRDLENWFQAESEVLENSIVAPLYRRLKSTSPEPVQDQDAENGTSETENVGHSACETGV